MSQTKLLKNLKRKKFLFATGFLVLSLFLFLAVSQAPQDIRQRAQTAADQDTETEDEGPEPTDPPQCAAKQGICVAIAGGCEKDETDEGQLDCATGEKCCAIKEEAAKNTPPASPTVAATQAPAVTDAPTPTIEPTATTALVGDVNGDNTLNAMDYNEIVSCYDRRDIPPSCDPTKKQKTDLNQDGTINGVDINLFLRAASKK